MWAGGGVSVGGLCGWDVAAERALHDHHPAITSVVFANKDVWIGWCWSRFFGEDPDGGLGTARDVYLGHGRYSSVFGSRITHGTATGHTVAWVG